MSVIFVIGLAPVAWGAPQEPLGASASQTPGSRLITYNGILKDAEGRRRWAASA